MKADPIWICYSFTETITSTNLLTKKKKYFPTSNSACGVQQVTVLISVSIKFLKALFISKMAEYDLTRPAFGLSAAGISLCQGGNVYITVVLSIYLLFGYIYLLSRR